jgi:hypothetical protein
VASEIQWAQMVDERPRSMLKTVARLTTYWLFLVWLLLGFCFNVVDVLDYLEDPVTYNQVYRGPLSYQAVMWGWAVLTGAALALQAVGWRTGSFSAVAVAISAAFVCSLFVGWRFGIFETCCG